MRHIYLHAGLPKTGSSAIQAFLSERREAMLRLGFLFPETGATNSGNHKPLVLDMLGQSVPTSHQNSAQKFWQEVARHPEHKVILSSEYIGGNIGKEGGRERFLGKLLRTLHEAGFRTTILIYLRPDAERINSSYVQRVKTFSVGTPPFREFALQQTARAKVRYAQLLTLARPSEVETIFRPYDAEVRRSGVVRDLLATVGIGEEERAALGEERRMNEAPVGPIVVAAAMATLARLERSEREIKSHQLAALRQELRKGVATAEEREQSFQGVDADLFHAMEDRVAEERERFAITAWGRSWDEVFGSGREREWNSNIFDPARAESQALERYERLCEHFWSAAQATKGRKAAGKGDKRTLADTPADAVAAWGRNVRAKLKAPFSIG